MEAAVSYLLMLQRYINSKRMIRKKKNYKLCLVTTLKFFTINNTKKNRIKRKCKVIFY